MKQLFAVVFILSAMPIFAQPKLSVFKSSASIRADIEKVASDYFEDFNNIKGDTIIESVSTIQFNSKVIPTGALDATVTKYKTLKSYSWQSTMFKTEEFKEAVAKYKQYFRQLEGATVTFNNKNSYKISGNYDAPDEVRSFASSTLEVKSYDPNLKLFKVEIGLNFAYPEWIVRIMVYEKPADEDIRPSAKM